MYSCVFFPSEDAEEENLRGEKYPRAQLKKRLLLFNFFYQN